MEKYWKENWECDPEKTNVFNEAQRARQLKIRRLKWKLRYIKELKIQTKLQNRRKAHSIKCNEHRQEIIYVIIKW